MSLPASVCLSICLSVCLYVRKLYLVRMITCHRFELESPNLHQTCIVWYSLLVLKMEVIDLEPQGHFGHFNLEFQETWLVCMIIFNRFELESPNLYQICILGFSQLVLKMGVINYDLQGHLAIVLTQDTAINTALVYWSRPAKGCYTSQTCSCLLWFYQLSVW